MPLTNEKINLYKKLNSNSSKFFLTLFLCFFLKVSLFAQTWDVTNLGSALVAWYDANDYSTITESGGTVSQWDDKSGNNYHATQSTPSLEPTYTASDALANSKPSIGNAAGTADVGLITPSFSAQNVYAVFYFDDGATTPATFYTLLSGPGANSQYRVMTTSSGGWITTNRFNDGGSYKNGYPDDSTSNSAPMPASVWQFDASASRTQVWAIGYFQKSSMRAWKGAYSEFIFTDGTETSAQQDSITGYLAHKWGVDCDLVYGHAFREYAPSNPPANWHVPYLGDTLVAWFDAKDACSITQSGGTVSQWDDKSGNDYHATQSTSSLEPTYTASDALMNSMPSIGNAAGTADIGLTTPSFGAKRVYAAFYFDDGATTPATFYTLLSGPGANSQYRVMTTSSGGWITTNRFNDGGSYKNGYPDDSTSNSAPMPASVWQFDASASRTQVWAIGYLQTSSMRAWKGAYSEFIFTDGTELSATQDKIVGYLAHKWGTEADLVSGHTWESVSPLPVELIYFTAKMKNSHVLIKWKTATEINNDYFLLQKSIDGINWETIANLQGAGNSTEPIEYSYTDSEIQNEVIYYRIIQFDFDGTSETFKTVVVNTNKKTNEFNLTIYPQPIENFAKINFKVPEEGMYNFKIYDIVGKVVYSSKLIGIKGDNWFNINISTFNSGTYIFSLSDNNGRVISQKAFIRE